LIIQSLCRCYDILDNDESVSISRPGYSSANISFVLVISRDGKLSHIVDQRSDDKKPKPKRMEVPLQKSRSSGIAPYFASDKSEYVFGIEKVKGEKKEKMLSDRSAYVSLLEDIDGAATVVSKHSNECFEKFREFQHQVLDNPDDPGTRAFLRFLDNWNPENFLENPKIMEYKDDILASVKFVFECEGNYLHKNSAVREAWENYLSHKTDGDSQISQCLVSGKLESISKVHQKIRGVIGTHSSGAPLVTFNKPAFCSYNKEQSYNAPVSESSMFKYTTALNYLLANKDNRIRIADTMVVFWAETNDRSYEEFANFCFAPREDINKEKEKESADDSRIQDQETLKTMEDILSKIRSGRHLNKDEIAVDPDTKFYILGLSPNNARLAIRFWYVDTFGNFLEKVGQHHLDMEIIRNDSEPKYTSVYGLLMETVAKSSTDRKASPILGGLIMRSILNNTTYPIQMYSAILNRVKVERSINRGRAGFIKAYLLRVARSGSTNIKEDLITMKLNEDNSNVPYRLGRLFAVLEKVQSETNKSIGSTINSKYFSSASATPSVVFPVLLKLAQHHIAKSDWGFKSSQSIEEILSGVDEFPKYLGLEEQGMFMLGYYHQRKANYTKKEKNSSVKEE